ncbi:hypothetical protein C7W88_01835 [Novosphingobium sp. THN1]|nr:hypothetical protein C7W88_01835 [Novosphingobium sp. THN1]
MRRQCSAADGLPLPGAGQVGSGAPCAGLIAQGPLRNSWGDADWRCVAPARHQGTVGQFSEGDERELWEIDRRRGILFCLAPAHCRGQPVASNRKIGD